MSSGTLYSQIQNDLAKRILTSELAPDTMLPTETALCAAYGVSRITVRRAVDELVRSRMLYRRQGVGTYVAGTNDPHKAVKLSGYIDDILPVNNHRLLNVDSAKLPNTLLELIPNGPASRMKRFTSINHIEGAPFSFAKFYFPDDVAQMVDADDFSAKLSPIKIVETRTGRAAARALQVVRPDVANTIVSRHLGIKRGTPLLTISRVYLTNDERLLEAVEASYHPDRYRFTVDLLPHSPARSLGSSNRPFLGTSLGSRPAVPAGTHHE